MPVECLEVTLSILIINSIFINIQIFLIVYIFTKNVMLKCEKYVFLEVLKMVLSLKDKKYFFLKLYENKFYKI